MAEVMFSLGAQLGVAEPGRELNTGSLRVAARGCLLAEAFGGAVRGGRGHVP
jgi:hypothetical protein